MLLDNLLPVYEFNEYHTVAIEAPPGHVFAALKQLTPSEVPLFRTLFLIRALPGLILHKGQPPFRGKQSIFEQALQAGFTLLAEQPDQELVLGIIGQFWRLSGNKLTVANAQEFIAVDQPGYAKAAMNFVLHETSSRSLTRLATETRIHISDPHTRKRFAVYWFFIRWGSGLIRRLGMQAIKRRAEGDYRDGRNCLTRRCSQPVSPLAEQRAVKP